MKFLADINIPQSVINALVNNGHNVLDIKKQNLTFKDTELIAIAQKEKRIILTRDKDFIALTQFPKYHVAVIIIRLKDQKPDSIKNRLGEFLKNQHESIITKSLTIIKEDSARSYPYE